MNGLREKFRNKKGFTLIEMLIVVAIIAILIAVSIPLVGNALERARESTDAANERAFKAELLIQYLNADGKNNFQTDKVYAYDADAGAIKLTGDAGFTKVPAAYGQSTKTKGVDENPRTGMILYGMVDANGEVSMGWGAPAVAAKTDLSGLTAAIGSTVSKTEVAP